MFHIIYIYIYIEKGGRKMDGERGKGSAETRSKLNHYSELCKPKITTTTQSLLIKAGDVSFKYGYGITVKGY